jgi:DNA-binding CsgD family transcriptional regulator
MSSRIYDKARRRRTSSSRSRRWRSPSQARRFFCCGRDLHVARAEAERWRSEAHELLAGLGAAVSEQFDRWALTAAEQEVGLLLLKGLSHKEVADVRSTSERTVRQQALAIYRKAGLGGRAELAAFFFEDLLLPVDTAPRRTEGEEKS